jgi:outer membrane biosynthesis protein TonB
MTEGRAIAVAAGLHALLLVALSVSLAGRMLPETDPDVTPIEFVEISDVTTVTTPPRPSRDAAPQEPEPPSAAEEMPEAPPAPELPQPPAPARAAADTAAQDAIAEAVAAAPQPRQLPSKAKPAETAGQNAALVDKSRPRAAVKPRDPEDFAKSIEDAIPKQARLSAIQSATLEQAIRAQIAPCWNPPIGGADVAEMTAVLRIRLNRDGTVAAPPEFVSQTGATAGNQAYARAFVETARRAVLRCAPLQLPADLYSYWREFELNFDPRLMT